MKIQKSTRTTIPHLAPLHNHLQAKFKWYCKWHLNRFATTVHVAVLALYIVGMAGGIFLFQGYVPKQAQAASWMDAAWRYRATVTIDHTKVGTGGVTNYPVLVTGANMPAGLWANAKADGSDLRVTNSTGNTEINFELVSFTPGSTTMELWFLASSLSDSSDTTFYLYWGNAGASAKAAAWGQGVWTNGYAGVWHLGEASGTIHDSTSNGYSGSAQNSPTYGAPGKMGGAIQFNGSNQSINLGNISPLAGTTYTIQAWCDGTSGGGYAFMKGDDWQQAHNSYGLSVSTNVSFATGQNSTAPMWLNTAANSISYGTWASIAGVISAGAKKVYINGLDTGVSQTDSYSIAAANVPLNIAITSRGAPYSYAYPGIVDEVRISTSARTAPWLLSEYNNESSPATFYAMGMVQDNTLNSISGTINDGVGHHIAGVSVSDGTRTATTAGDGTYTIVNVPDGTYTLTPTKTGYTFSPATLSATVAGAEELTGNNFTAFAWLDPAWRYRTTITIDHTKVGSGGVTNYPVLLTGANMPAGLWANAKADGSDLRVTSGDGAIETNFELVSFTPGSTTMQLWFLAANLSSSTDTTFYLYWGNAGASAKVASWGQAVWTAANYLAVWHTTEASGDLADATGNGHTAVYHANGGAATYGVAGVFGTGITLDAKAYFQVAYNSALAPTRVTMESWANPNSPQSFGAVMSRPYGASWVSPYSSYAILGNASGGGHAYTAETVNGSNKNITSTGAVLSNGTWYHLAASYDGTTVKLFQDGVSGGTSAGSGNLTYGSNQDLMIGVHAAYNLAEFWKGTIQELRLASVAQSDQWFLTDKNNQSSPATFYSTGAAQDNTLNSISGTINDGSGNHISGVSVSDGTRTATTAGDGTYTIVSVPDGAYTLTPTKFNWTFSPTTSSATVAGAEELTGNNFTGIPGIGGTSNESSGTVAVAINGTLQAQTGTIASGTWSIAGVTVNSGDVVTTFISGAIDANESTAVTKYDGSSDISGMVLNQNVLSIGSGDNQNLSVTNLSQYTNTNNEDVMQGVSGSTLSVDGGGSYTTPKLSILANNTLTISGTETVNTYDIAIAGALVSGGNSIYNIAGSWDSTGGVFNPSTSTVNFTAGASGKTLAGTMTGTSAFYNLTFNNASGGWTASNDITVSNILTITAGNFNASSRTITLPASGTPFVNTGTLTPGTSTFIYTNSANVAATTYNNLTLTNATGSAHTATVGSGTLAISGNLLISTTSSGGETLNCNTNNPIVNLTGNVSFTKSSSGALSVNLGTGLWTISGIGDFRSVTVTAPTGSKIIMNGSGKTFFGNNQTFYDLQISNNIADGSNTDSFAMNGTLTIDTGKTFTLPFQNVLTMNSGSTTNIQGTLEGFMYAGFYTTLRLYDSAAANLSTTGTFKYGIIEFYAVNQDITIPTRTYNLDRLRVYNTSSTNRIATVGTAPGQTLTCGDGGIYNCSMSLWAMGTGDITLDASAYNPNISIRSATDAGPGNLSFAGTGSGTERIKAGSGTWTLGHNLDLTNGTIDAGSSTFVFNRDYTHTITSAGNSLYNVTTTLTPRIVYGATTFNDATNITGTLTDITSDSQISFKSGVTHTINNVNIAGTSGHLIYLASTDTSGWTFNPTTISASTYLNVSRSTNIGTPFCATYSTDGLNNVGWYFSAGAVCIPIAPTGVAIGNLGSTTFDTTWTDNSFNETGFKVYISTTANADCSLATYPGSPDYATAADAATQLVTGKSINTQYCAKVAATNTAGDSTASYSSPKYTLANQPNAPTVNTAGATSLTIIIDANSNPSSTQFAIYNQTTGQYVQADGSPGALAVWQDRATWGGDSGVINTSLSINTSYSYQVKARNGENTETSLSSGTSKYTLANVPSAPTVNATGTTSLTIIINQNSNPDANTRYAIYNDTAGKYVKHADGTLQDTEDWQLYADWGGGSGFTNVGLTPTTTYTYKVKAENGDNTATALSDSTSKYTLANIPSAPTVSGDYSVDDGYHADVIINTDNNPAGTNYRIQASTNGTDFFNPSGMAWQTDTTYKLTILTPNTQYWFKIKAKNGDNTETVYSASGADVTPPAAPTDLNHSNVCTTTVSTSWVASTGADKYTFSYGTDVDATNPGTITDIAVTNKDLTGLIDATTYYFKVSATSNANGTGAYSTIDNFTTGSCTAPVAPSDFNGSAASTTRINWTWSDTATDETGWRVEDVSHTNLSGALSVGSTSWNETPLSINTAYTRHANVYNLSGSNDSNQATVYTLANVPEAPTLAAVSMNSIKITINKNGNPDANTRYAIYNQTAGKYVKHADGTLQSDPDWQLYADWGGVDGFVNTGLSPNVSYIYQVKAENGDYTGTDFSSQTSISTQDEPTPTPTATPPSPTPSPTTTTTVPVPTPTPSSTLTPTLPPEYRYLYLVITPDPPSLQRGESVRYRAKVLFDQDDLTSQCTVSWYVINSGAGTIDSASGQFTASQNAGLWSGAIKAAADCPQGSTFGLAGASIITEPRRLNYVWSTPYAPFRSVYKGIDNDLAQYTIYGQDQYHVNFALKDLSYTKELPDSKIGEIQSGPAYRIPIITSNNYGCYPDKIKATATYQGVTKEGYNSINIFPPEYKSSGPRVPKNISANTRNHFRPNESYHIAVALRDQYSAVMDGASFVFIMNKPEAGELTPDGYLITSGNEATYQNAYTIKGIVNGIEVTRNFNLIVSSSHRQATTIRYAYPKDLGKTKIIKIAPGETREIQAYLYDQFGDIVIYESGDRLSKANSNAPVEVSERNITASSQTGFYQDAVRLSFDWPNYADYDKHIEGPSPEVLFSVDINPNNAVDPKVCLSATGGNGGGGTSDNINNQVNSLHAIDIPWLPAIINDILNILAKYTAVFAIISAIAAVIGLIMGPLSNLVSLYSLPESIHMILYSFLLVGASKRKRNKWGKIIEQSTEMPLANVVVNLVKVDESGAERVIETTYTDKNGAYGFAVEPGAYKVMAKKDKYEIVPVDSQSYEFNPDKIYKIENYNQGWIIPTIVLAPTNGKIKGIYKVLMLFRKIEKVINYISIIILTVGTILIVHTIYYDRSLLNWIILSGYILLWILNITLLIRRSPWSTVVDKFNYRPIALSLIRITNIKTNKLIKTTVSDHYGKFSAILKRGKYNLFAIKAGYKMDKSVLFDVSADLNIVHKKIELERNILSSE